MRIISKFTDYYDSAGVWYSPDPTFVREFKELDISEFKEREILLQMESILDKMPSNNYGICTLIAFCGKAYPCYQHSNYYAFEDKSYSNDNTTFYSLDKIEEHCKCIIKDRKSHDECNTAQEIINMLHGKNSGRGYVSHRWKPLNYKNWEAFLLEANLDIPQELFIAVNSPIFLLYKHNRDTLMEINPMLKKLNFASQVDPYTAFQEIEMYVGNQLVMQMDPNVNMTDELIRDSKGMDKWSFKKHTDDNKKTRKRKKRKK